MVWCSSYQTPYVVRRYVKKRALTFSNKESTRSLDVLEFPDHVLILSGESQTGCLVRFGGCLPYDQHKAANLLITPTSSAPPADVAEAAGASEKRLRSRLLAEKHAPPPPRSSRPPPGRPKSSTMSSSDTDVSSSSAHACSIALSLMEQPPEQRRGDWQTSRHVHPLQLPARGIRAAVNPSPRPCLDTDILVHNSNNAWHSSVLSTTEKNNS